MPIYDDTYQMCDNILGLFSPEQPAGHNEGGIIHLLGYTKGTKQYGLITPALHKLEVDKYLIRYGHNNDLFKIGGDTLSFKEQGSYKGWVERENRNDELKRAINDLGLKTNQSVIDTNNSIKDLNASTKKLYDKVLPDTFEEQRKSTNRSLILAGFSVLFIGITAYLQWKDKLPTTVQDLKQQVQKSLQSLDSIRAYIKGIDSSIQKRSDTIYVKMKK